jgi:hypothetical protein
MEAACPSRMLETLLISTWSNNTRRESPSLSKLAKKKYFIVKVKAIK